MDNKEDRSIRINRYLSLAGLGSRRRVEQLVLDRRVQVDGETVDSLGVRVQEGQTVRVDGKTLHPTRSTVVFALNKPVRVVVSDYDPDRRPLAIDIVRPHYSGRIFSIGRLDYMSGGLLLFTNDGHLAQQLMRPHTYTEREYVVETAEPIGDEVLNQFVKGIIVEGVVYRAASWRRHSARRVSLVLTEGKNREIRRVFGDFRLKVRRIYRHRYGPIALGSLPEGHVRQLSEREVERLRASLSRRKRPRRESEPVHASKVRRRSKSRPSEERTSRTSGGKRESARRDHSQRRDASKGSERRDRSRAPRKGPRR